MTTEKITHVDIRMYRLGTGDCFALKYFKGDDVSFTMLIDCGACSGTGKHLAPYIAHLKAYIGAELDLLVITHEHKDHVYGFDACDDLWLAGDIKIKKIWMGWTENDADRKVSRWKKEYGEKKKALALVADRLNSVVSTDTFKAQFRDEANGKQMIQGRLHFAGVLNYFSDLHVGAKPGEYKGMLRGMEVVKKHLANGNIEYLDPGQIVKNIEGLEGIKFYVLGPPGLYADIKKEKGTKGETYDHNKDLATTGALAAAVTNTSDDNRDILPFEDVYLDPQESGNYQAKKHTWRRIDYDWLYSGGALALRMNSLTNNLSLALAIEIGDDKKVMLFPGDAEYGSWASWQKIKWPEKPKDQNKTLTEELLNRTVFYKVAHHLSHNGTAKNVGMDMMTDEDLVAMATLDYDIIGHGWSSTMPNRALLKDLINKTKGRLLIMNEKGLFYDVHNKEKLTPKIKAARAKMSKKEQEAFNKAVETDTLYIQYTLRLK
jgi:hypothetical protein